MVLGTPRLLANRIGTVANLVRPFKKNLHAAVLKIPAAPSSRRQRQKRQSGFRGGGSGLQAKKLRQAENNQATGKALTGKCPWLLYLPSVAGGILFP
jgi:hypothetical protein